MNPNSIPENTNNHHEATSGPPSQENTPWGPHSQDLDKKIDSHLQMNKWNPVVGEYRIVTQAEQNIEYKDTCSDEISRNFKQQRIEYSKNTLRQDQNDKSDILHQYSIRELDPEWCNSQDQNALQRSLVVPNNSIDKTHVLENSKIGVFNSISDRNLCITDKSMNSSDLKINKFETQHQPMVENKRFKPVPAISESRVVNNFLEFSNSLHTQLERNNGHETKCKEEVISEPKNSISIISSQIIPSNKSTNIIDCSFTPNVVGVRNVQSQDGIDGDLLGASSHIINFKNNVYNIPPPPISPP